MSRGDDYEEPLGGLETGAVQLVVVAQDTLLPALLPALPSSLSIWIPPSQPILPAIISSSSVLPLPGITLLLFYQPEPWIKPSSGKNLITYKIYKGLGGRQYGCSGIRET